MDHPLKAVLGQVKARQRYAVRDVAELLGVAVESARALDRGGWLPGGSYEPMPGAVGGRRKVWTGAELRAAAEVEELPPLDHSRYAPATLWRWGCGCPECTAWHNASTGQWKRGRAEQAFPAQARARLLELVADGAEVKDAAAELGLPSSATVYARARWDAEFSEALDEAAGALCKDAADSRCGTPAGYRWMRCRATACRRAHNPDTRPART